MENKHSILLFSIIVASEDLSLWNLSAIYSSILFSYDVGISFPDNEFLIKPNQGVDNYFMLKQRSSCYKSQAINEKWETSQYLHYWLKTWISERIGLTQVVAVKYREILLSHVWKVKCGLLLNTVQKKE